MSPSKEDLSKAISHISSGNAPRLDDIPAEVFKCSGNQLFDNLHQLICKCWEEGYVAQEMRDSIISTQYKNKGDRNDRNNYRGISLLCIAGKPFARVASYRLHKIAERVGTVQYDENRSEAFDINSGVKQGCVLAPTLFNIFSLILNHAFKSSEERILIRSRSDGRLFNPARLRAKTKVRKVAIRDLLFADDVALVARGAEKLQLLLNQFSDACEAFRLTISLKKTKVMCQDNAATPTVTIKDYTLEAVTQFTYLGSTTSNNNCLEVEIGKRIGKAATNMAKLSARVWENKKLTTQTKVAVYR
ncbi:hypothetical protein AWC38_SpisGene23083 [Stylophora pistillata]|uniref:Reverse transcriptase domain-containing protein n=1 Tax=Stylophora pistillata TaxID=50429 RepID=A0A2B4R954_STYPI|nr:hypothetical protein AWC38_SpisGene23083 [Stylophora pistillata]